MKNILLTLFCVSFSFLACKKKEKQKTPEEIIAATEAIDNEIEKSKDPVKIWPIEHATMVLEYNAKTIYIDPTGGASAFKNHKKPDLILITDIHGDHLDLKTLNQLDTQHTTFVVPMAVATKLPKEFKNRIATLDNHESTKLLGIHIKALPMYNLRKEAQKFHKKGRGNGYLLTLGNQRVYISGDTEDIPEMRELQHIDIAFICMNLPYTMPITSAANAVLDFKPQKVYPYHYRGTAGLSDIKAFKKLVYQKNPTIQVIQLDWYPKK